MEDSDKYAPNSHKAKSGASEAPRKKLDRVVTSGVKPRKKSMGASLLHTLVGGDPKTAIHTMVMGVLVPAARDAVADAATRGVETLIFGEARRTRASGPRPGGVSNYTSYNTIAKRTDDRPPNPLLRRPRTHWEYEEVSLASRVEADEVIERLYEELEKYDSVSVAGLNELLGLKTSHTDMKWGWTDLRGTTVRRERDGTFTLNLPTAEPLNS